MLEMKRILLFILFLTTAAITVAQTKFALYGSVKDMSGQPLQSVTVLVKGNSSLWGETDPSGNFTLKLSKGTYTLIFNHIGYHDLEQEVTINGNSSIEVTLADESQKLSEVMVVGKSNAQILKESAFATSAFNIKPIVSSVHNINNVLGKTTGVKIREEGGVGSDFDLSINGMSGNSVRYFLDGIPLDTKGSGVNLANLPVNLIERVEIYKGVIPASLGADALGGAINIVTNRQKKNFLDFSYGYGSFNTHKGELFAQVVTPKTGIMIKPVVSANYSANNYVMKGVEVPNEDNTRFETGDFERFHDDYFSLYGELEVGVANRKWADAFFVGGSFSKVDKELQTGSVQTKVYGMAERHTLSKGVSAVYNKKSFIVEDLAFSASASYSWDHSRTIDTTYRKYFWNGTYIDGARSEITGRAKSLRHYKRPMAVVRTNFDYRLSDKHSLNLNYMFNRTGNEQYDDVDDTYEPSKDAVSKHIVGFSYNQLLADGKMENVLFVKDYINHVEIGQTELGSITGANTVERSTTKDYWGYGAGTKFKLVEEVALKASYEHSVRLPLSKELLGNGSTIYANVQLRPESSENFNIGVFGNIQASEKSHIYYEVNSFMRLVDDYIQIRVSEKEGMMQYENIPAVHIKGVEGEVNYTYSNKLHIMANISWQDSRDQRKYLDDGKPSATYRNRTPNKPWIFCNAEASYTFRNVFFKDASLKLAYNYQWVHWFYLTWEAYGSNASKARIPTQNISNASVLYQLKDGKYNIFLECSNLFDAMAYDNYMLQKPGRAFFLKFRVFID